MNRLRVPHSRFRMIRGFTLVEIMLVVIIIGVLAAMVVPRFAGRTEQAKISRAKSDIAAIGLALDLYELDLGSYPKQLPDLVTKPAGVEEWKGPYLKKAGSLTDPWGHEYHYKSPSDHPDMDYDLSSDGPTTDAGDNLVNWQS